MKLGIFSDIHADDFHLRKALDLFHKLKVDQLLCAGDLVDGATEGEAAAQRVKALNIPVVMGNHDRAFGRPIADDWHQGMTQRYGIDDHLSHDTTSYLASLPFKRELAYDGIRIVLAHANIWDLSTYVFPSPGSHERLFRLGREVDADALILGHTHVPMKVHVDGLWVFNPGSVQGNRYLYRPEHTVAVLHIPDLNYEVYDILSGRLAQPERVMLTPPA